MSKDNTGSMSELSDRIYKLDGEIKEIKHNQAQLFISMSSLIPAVNSLLITQIENETGEEAKKEIFEMITQFESFSKSMFAKFVKLKKKLNTEESA